MRIALAQVNPTIGDLDANRAGLVRAIEQARAGGADLVLTPELSICGYPPRDLLLHAGFVRACAESATQIGERCTSGITAVLGVPRALDSSGHSLANSLLVYHDNRLVETYDKRLLPTYDVFDEDRYFEPGARAAVIGVAGERVGLAICEDLWMGEDAGFADRYRDAADPVAELVRAGATVVACPSASPFVLSKVERHGELLARHARTHGVWVASVNAVGGQDDLIFDGHSAVYAPDGTRQASGPGFEEHLLVCDTARDQVSAEASKPGEELLFRALVLGTRDYVHKTGFDRALLGVSGGIDSAVTAAIAAAALGPSRVLGLAMPGKYSSSHALQDAEELASRIGMPCVTVPIEPAFDGARAMLDPAMAALEQPALGSVRPDLAEENLQSRMRGVVTMTMSNRTGAIVLTTGNKSELAVGYCTLYGDMNGGLAVLPDVSKTAVYALARWINEHHAACGFDRPPIPESTIEKPPSAELAPDQLDSDSLPTYDVLDEIVERVVERRQDAEAVIRETGFDADVVRRMTRLIRINEYKRRQLAVGLKVTRVAFGPGRRMPIAQGWNR